MGSYVVLLGGGGKGRGTRAAGDVVRIEGAKGVGFSVFLIHCPRKKRPKPVIDPENPPWWWRPPGHVYVPPRRAALRSEVVPAFHKGPAPRGNNLWFIA